MENSPSKIVIWGPHIPQNIDVSDITGTKTISFKYLVGIYADYTVMVDSVSALATVSSLL